MIWTHNSIAKQIVEKKELHFHKILFLFQHKCFNLARFCNSGLHPGVKYHSAQMFQDKLHLLFFKGFMSSIHNIALIVNPRAEKNMQIITDIIWIIFLLLLESRWPLNGFLDLWIPERTVVQHVVVVNSHLP